MSRLKNAVNLKSIREVEAPVVEAVEAPPQTPPKAPPKEPPLPPCALEGAPNNSKIVVVLNNGKKTPILATPQGVYIPVENDVAWTLTTGAKITKVSEDKYIAIQLDHNRAVEPLEGSSVRDVIQRFHKHFHG